MNYKTITGLFLFLFIGNPAFGVQSHLNLLQKKEVLLPEGEKINVWVVDTIPLRTRGLMGVSYLDLKEGMLFLFDSDEPHLIWMKNMVIPLDILWLNEREEIIAIKEGAPPCSREPCEIYGQEFPSRYVLEMKKGAIRSLHLKKGMVLKF